MDFTMVRNKGEGIHELLFFKTKFSHPREKYVDHLRTMEEVTFIILFDDIGYNY